MSRRTAAWLAWAMSGLVLALIICTFVLFALNHNTLALSSPYFLVGEATASLVGGLVAYRRPANPVGWFIIGHALCFTVGEFARQYAIYGVLTEPDSLPLARAMAWPSYWVWWPGIILMFSLLPLYFPNGRLLSPRWRPVVWVAVLATVLMSGIAAVQPTDRETPGIPNPLGVETLRPFMDSLNSATVLWLGLSVASAASLVVRYRRSGGEQRQQIKWVVYAVVLVVASSLVHELLGIASHLPPILNELLLLIDLAVLWIAIAVAVLKNRLYDIDVVINRTLVYGSLTATLVALYFGGIVLLQRVFVVLTGEKSTLAVVASTLVIAALFNPLRRRIQSFIDRRFYRRKYNVGKTLEAFSARLRDETKLDALNAELVSVVRETMQPAHVSLWLRPDRPSKGEQAD